MICYRRAFDSRCPLYVYICRCLIVLLGRRLSTSLGSASSCQSRTIDPFSPTGFDADHTVFATGPVRRDPVSTMAGAVAVSIGKPGKRYNAKMTAYVWFLCLIGGSGGLLLGYDNGVIGKPS